MMTKDAFFDRFSGGVHLLDGATGSNLIKAGMPAGCCAEAWILENPDALVRLQGEYAAVGSEIIYAPTFQAQPLALAKHGLERNTEEINARLVALSRRAAPHALIAGNMTTLAACMNVGDDAGYAQMVRAYRRQIRGLMDGGADLLAAETLMTVMEAQAILEAAAAEGAHTVMCSFAARSDGRLFYGGDVCAALQTLERAGACVVGINCIAAEETLPGLVRAIAQRVRVPVLCKPNAGRPAVNDAGRLQYPIEIAAFTARLRQCVQAGASLVGGCCGTTPQYIQSLHRLRE